MPISINKCLITDEKVTDWIESETTFKYNLILNSEKYTLEYDKKTNWEQFLNKDRKLILKVWLWNKQWPITTETILTEPLLERALRQIDNPANDFYKKLDYFLLNYYQNGGRELTPLAITPQKRSLAFTDSIEEFERIIDAGKQKKWIENYDSKKLTRKVDYYIRLTDEGLKHCEELGKQAGIDLLRKDFRPLQGKSILLIYVEQDHKWGKLVSDELGDRGAGTTQHANGITSENTTYLLQGKRSLKDCDFVVFIKSVASDSVRIWGDMLAAAAEEEERSPQKAPLFFVFMADDSQIDEYSNLFFRNNRIWDLRLIPHQEKLFLYVASALNDRENKKVVNENTENSSEKIVESKLIPEAFDWPKLKLTKAQRHWLGFLYTKFLKGEAVDFEKEEPLHWEKFGKEKNPSQLNNLLAGGADIKLLGIWMIDNKSKFFHFFDDAILAIRKLFLERGGFDQINSDELKSIFPKASLTELRCIGKLLGSHGFSNGWGEKADGNFFFNIDGSRRDKIRLYSGIENLIQDEVKKQKNLELEEQEEDDINYEDDYGDMPEMFKNGTQIELSDRPSKIVLGVEGLASDIVEIIHRIPPQIGRMIGIFGPWGRGKTVLIEKTSSLLENSDKKWQSVKKIEKIFQSARIKKPVDYSDESNYKIIPFHAWKFQDTPASWAYLYECFADAYYRKPKSFWSWGGWANYFWRILKLNAHRTKLIPLLKIVGICAIAILLIWVLAKIEFPKLEEFETQLKVIGGTAIVTLAIFLFDRISKVYRTKASDLINRFASRTSFKNEMGIQAEIQKELQILLKVWLGNQRKRYPQSRLILIVEDIDRCSEDKIIHTIDGLRVMLENPEVAKWVIIICAVDERVLSRAVYSKYKDLMTHDLQDQKSVTNNFYYGTYSYPQYAEDTYAPDNQVPPPTEMQVLISEYFDKLFILAIKLGKLNSDERLDLIDAFIGDVQEIENSSSTQGNSNEDYAGQMEIEGNIYNFSSIDRSNQQNLSNARDGQDQPSSQTKDAKGIAFELFTADESGLVRSIVGSWEGATPRQIRIFYYRYMLAKNLLIQRYSSKSKENIWKTFPFAEYLPLSIMQYMNHYQPNLIYEKRVILMELDPNSEVNLPNNYSSPVLVSDYIELLLVLEIVIAY